MKKIYTFLSTLLYVYAFSQSGTLDPTFGNNGKVYTGFGTNNSSRANAVVLQPDGKIIVGGSAHTANTTNTWERDSDNFTLIRYNTDGSPDTAFGYDGKVMTDFYPFFNNNLRNGAIYALKLQQDGKILAYGAAGTGTVVVRYNSDGGIDANFGNNGIIHCNSGPVEGGNTLEIQPDGKIVVLGIQWTQPSANIWNTQFVVERYNADGSSDAAFASNGRIVTAFVSGYDWPKSIALQPDGKIVAIGQSTSGSNNRLALVRYTASGALDTTFDGDGKVLTSYGSGISGLPNFVTAHPNGKILVAGLTSALSGNSFTLVQYNSNGSPDTSFDGDGIASSLFDASDLSNTIISIAEQPDGKLLATTSADQYGTFNNPDDFVVRRYNSNATVDTSFGINGKVVTTVRPGFSVAKNIALQPDAKILVAGYSRPLESGKYDSHLVRYESSGALDPAFGTDGKLTATFDSTNDESTHLLIQPDSKLIAIGTKRNATENGYLFKDIALSRYNIDGSLDASFGDGGKVVSVFAENNRNTIHQAVLQPDGKIVISNTYFNQHTGDGLLHHELIRYTSYGVVDITFGTDGKVVIDAETTAMLCQPDGKIILVTLSYDSQSNATIILQRYTANGTIDSTFGNNGATGFPATVWGPVTAALQPDGKIVITGSSPNMIGAGSFNITRFNADGNLDTTFENEMMEGETGRYAHATFVQPDGKIVMAGRSSTMEDGIVYVQFVTARYNPNGSFDTEYGTNGITVSGLGSVFQPYNIFRSIVMQPDGKFLVALTKQELNPSNPNPGSYDIVIHRFNADGGYDIDFGALGEAVTQFYTKYDEAFSMVLQPDHKIVVGGTTDTGINRDFALVRFNNTITLGSNDRNDIPNSVILYPNPVKNILNIAGADAAGIIAYSIFDMLGKVIYKGTGENLQVDTQNFSSGIYNVVITTDKGIVNRKFIKE